MPLLTLYGFVIRTDAGPTNVIKYLGPQNTPGEIKRLRRSVHDIMREMGTPVLVKHMWNDEDVKAGIAIPSPDFDDVYGQTRNLDPLSHGAGYCSAVFSSDEWYNTSTGEVVKSSTSPGAGYTLAPRYRGFGPGFLTYMIEPDRAEDFFKMSSPGTLFGIQNAYSIGSWFPKIEDNDLIVRVTLDSADNITGSDERFQAKMTSPITIRGQDRRGRREYSGDEGNRHVINQQFERARSSASEPVIFEVEIDR